MAVVQNPIVGRAIGKVANSVFTKWKGRNIWKSKAISVFNPQTDGQLKQRARFSIITMLGSVLLSVIRLGFKEQATDRTESNVFNSTNQRNGFLAWNGSKWEQDFVELEISKGSLDPTAVAVTGATAGSSSLVITFPATVSGNQSLGDKMSIVALNNDNVAIKAQVVARNAGTYTLALPQPLAVATELYVYTFFTSADGKKSSNNTNYSVVV